MTIAMSSLSKNVSRETFTFLESYVELLLKWNAKINLIGPATKPDVWSRHVEDALQLVPLIPAVKKSVVDVGSGAGLPGMILAIARPTIQVTLVEIDQRKSAFLNEVKRSLALTNVTVEAKDISHISGPYDIITARALAPLANLLAMAFPLMDEASICLFPKGENYAKEVMAAEKDWAFNHVLSPSITNEKSTIIMITELSKPTHAAKQEVS